MASNLDKIKELEGKYEQKIRDHPFASAGVALGVGALAGMAVGRYLKPRCS